MGQSVPGTPHCARVNQIASGRPQHIMLFLYCAGYKVTTTLLTPAPLSSPLIERLKVA